MNLTRYLSLGLLAGLVGCRCSDVERPDIGNPLLEDSVWVEYPIGDEVGEQPQPIDLSCSLDPNPYSHIQTTEHMFELIKNTEETILYSAFVLDPKLPEPGIWSDENRKELRTSFFGNFDRFTSDVYELFPEIDEVEQRNCLIERIVDISEQQFGKTKREVVEGIRDEAFKEARREYRIHHDYEDAEPHLAEYLRLAEQTGDDTTIKLQELADFAFEEARREYRIHHDYEDAEPHLAEYLRLAEQTGDDTTVKLQELAAIAFDEAKSQYNYNSIGAHYYGKAQPHLDQYVELSKQAGNDPKEKLQELVTIVLDEARKHCGLEGCTDEADPHLIQAQSLATTYELTEVSTQIQQLRN